MKQQQPSFHKLAPATLPELGTDGLLCSFLHACLFDLNWQLLPAASMLLLYSLEGVAGLLLFGAFQPCFIACFYKQPTWCLIRMAIVGSLIFCCGHVV